MFKRVLKSIVAPMLKTVLRNSALRTRILKILNAHPAIKQFFRRIAYRAGIFAVPLNQAAASRMNGFATGKNFSSVDLANLSEEALASLTPRAARLYIKLQKATRERKD